MFSKKEVGDKIVISGIKYLRNMDERAMTGKMVGTIVSIGGATFKVDTGSTMRSYYKKSGLAYSRGDNSRCSTEDPMLVEQANADLLRKVKADQINVITRNLYAQSIAVLEKILRDMTIKDRGE